MCPSLYSIPIDWTRDVCRVLYSIPIDRTRDVCRVLYSTPIDRTHDVSLARFPFNRRSSEIQGTALGKCLQAWPVYIGPGPAGVAQSRHAFVGGTVLSLIHI